MGRALIAIFAGIFGIGGSIFATKDGVKAYKTAKQAAHEAGKKWTWDNN